MSMRPWWTDNCKPVLTGSEVFADLQWVDDIPVTVATFRSLDHVMDVVEDCMPLGHHGIKLGNSNSWTYGKAMSKEDTYKALREGRSPSEETRKIYMDIRDKVQGHIIQGDLSKARSARRRRVRSWAGGSVNVNRYLESRNSGRVIPCFNSMRKRADRQVIRIGINVLMSCGNDQKSWFNLSANAAAMCEALEQLGYGVEIMGVSACKYTVAGRPRKVSPNGEKCKAHRSFRYATQWTLKSANDPLDVERIMSIGCPGMARDVTFRIDALCHGVMYLVGGKEDGRSSCMVMPDKCVKALGYDILMEKSWTTGSTEQNASRVIGKVKEMLG